MSRPGRRFCLLPGILMICPLKMSGIKPDNMYEPICAVSTTLQRFSETSMEQSKVIVRYVDGRVVKGFTQDFFPNKECFHLRPLDSVAGNGLLEVHLKDLKALFFVRDFGGNPSYNERKAFVNGERAQGRKVEVTFKDGEKVEGATLGYDPNRSGFFFFPADDKCNNIRVFAIKSFVDSVRYI